MYMINEQNIDDFTSKQLSLFIIQGLRSLQEKMIESEAKQTIWMEQFADKFNALEKDTIKDVNTVEVQQRSLVARLNALELKQDNIVSGTTKLPYVTQANLISVLTVVGGVIIGVIQIIKMI